MTRRPTAYRVATVVAVVAMLFGNLTISHQVHASNLANAVSARIKPDTVYREMRGPYLRLNFDVELKNESAEAVQINYIEMRLFDPDDKIVTRRYMGRNGLPGPISMLPSDEIPPNGKLYLFNPFPDMELGAIVARVEIRLFHTEGHTELAFQPEPMPSASLTRPPLAGVSYIFSGNDLLSHHRRVSLISKPATDLELQHVTQRYALDFTYLDQVTGDLANAPGASLPDWFGFDAPVLAPADGVIELVRADMPDNTFDANGNRVFTKEFDSYGDNAGLGNFIILRIEATESYLLMSHFRRGSITTSEGKRVKAGELIGNIGLSGDTAYPHLHIQMQDGVDPIASRPIPIAFRCVERNGIQVIDGSVDSGDFVANCGATHDLLD